MPLADVRILVVGKDQDGNFVIAADVSHTIGVTRSVLGAAARAALTVLGAFAPAQPGLSPPAQAPRPTTVSIPIIRIIATPDGYASLSQLQMVLWTFVVAASAVYVMVLSGDLIEITTGHAGAARHFGLRDGRRAIHDRTQSAKAAAAGVVIRRGTRKPCWSDLVVNEANGQRAIDITRVQMLYFTLITAIFVVMRVVSAPT